MREALEKEQASLKGELEQGSHRADGDYQANFPDYGRSEEDNATEMEDYQVNLATTTAARERLQEVEDALERIRTNTYGVTEDGIEIPEDRLRANPAAKTIIV